MSLNGTPLTETPSPSLESERVARAIAGALAHVTARCAAVSGVQAFVEAMEELGNLTCAYVKSTAGLGANTTDTLAPAQNAARAAADIGARCEQVEKSWLPSSLRESLARVTREAAEAALSTDMLGIACIVIKVHSVLYDVGEAFKCARGSVGQRWLTGPFSDMVLAGAAARTAKGYAEINAHVVESLEEPQTHVAKSLEELEVTLRVKTLSIPLITHGRPSPARKIVYDALGIWTEIVQVEGRYYTVPTKAFCDAVRALPGATRTNRAMVPLLQSGVRVPLYQLAVTPTAARVYKMLGVETANVFVPAKGSCYTIPLEAADEALRALRLFAATLPDLGPEADLLSSDTLEAKLPDHSVSAPSPELGALAEVLGVEYVQVNGLNKQTGFAPIWILRDFRNPELYQSTATRLGL